LQQIGINLLNLHLNIDYHMTLQEFTHLFCLQVEINDRSSIELQVTTSLVRRTDNCSLGRVNTRINIEETSGWISESNSAASMTSWNWDKVIDETKRMHLHHFGMQAVVVDWYPLNRTDVPDINKYYC
jgi:hypothetical protein